MTSETPTNVRAARWWTLVPTLALPVAAIAASAMAWQRMFVWLVIGAVFYGWLLAILLSMKFRPAQPAAGPWQMSLRRLLLNVTVFCVVLSVLTSDWPLRLRFALSRSQIEALADRVQNGQAVELPRYAGLFWVRDAEANRAGQPCLWTRLEPGGNTGLIRCRANTTPQLNLSSSLTLGEGWYLVAED
jgi:hypothetical protein